MSDQKIYVEPEGAIFAAVEIFEQACTGCNRCVDVCQVDVFLPSTCQEEPPVVMYPGECWHCGDCVDVCPEPGALRWNTMPKNQVHWKRKATGEDFYLE